MKPNILLAGATGYIGKNLVPQKKKCSAFIYIIKVS